MYIKSKKDQIKFIKRNWKGADIKDGQAQIFDKILARRIGITPIKVSFIRSEIGCVLYRQRPQTLLTLILKFLKIK